MRVLLTKLFFSLGTEGKVEPACRGATATAELLLSLGTEGKVEPTCRGTAATTKRGRGADEGRDGGHWQI